MFCDDANQLLEAFKEEFNIKKRRNKVRTISQSRKLHLDCCRSENSCLAILGFG